MANALEKLGKQIFDLADHERAVKNFLKQTPLAAKILKILLRDANDIFGAELVARARELVVLAQDAIGKAAHLKGAPGAEKREWAFTTLRKLVPKGAVSDAQIYAVIELAVQMLPKHLELAAKLAKQ